MLENFFVFYSDIIVADVGNLVHFTPRKNDFCYNAMKKNRSCKATILDRWSSPAQQTMRAASGRILLNTIHCIIVYCKLYCMLNCKLYCMLYIEYNLTWTVTQDVGILIRGTDDDGWNGMMVLLIWIVILIMVILGRMVLMNGLLVVFMCNQHQLWRDRKLVYGA